MKKLLFVLLITLVTSNIFAQKVKVDKKRGIMTIDQTDVCKFEHEKKDAGNEMFTFTALNSDDNLVVDLIRDGDAYYYVAASSLTDKKSEMKYELVSFTTSGINAITNLVVKKYNFFSLDGMNKQAIVDYLNTENRALSEAIAAKKADELAIQARINAYSPVISSDLKVTNKNTKELLGQFKVGDKAKEVYYLIDTQDHAFAELKKNNPQDNLDKIYNIYTYDKKTFSFESDGKKDPKLQAIELLILNDYMGNDANSYAIYKASVKEHNEKVMAEIENTEEENNKRSLVNNGVLTLANGEVKEGTFRIEFRQTPEGKLISTGGGGTIVNLDGNTLNYYYQDDKGKDKVKIYTQKQISSFKILSNETGNEELYVKLNYIEEPVPQEKKGLGGLIDRDGSIDLVGAGMGLLKKTPKDKEKTSLMYVASDKNNTAVYFFDDNIFVKNKKTNRTVKLNTANFEDQLKKIAAECPTTVHNVESGMFEYNLQSILDFSEELESCN